MLSKCFYSNKIDENRTNTLQKESLVSRIFFQKNQNWILNSGPKFSNFQKMVILHQKLLKSQKSPKLSKIFYINFERFEMVF